MDVSPETVSSGDQLSLVVSQTPDGDVAPVSSDCDLIFRGDTEALERVLADSTNAEADCTVEKCIWAQSSGSDMLFVSLESCSPVDVSNAERSANGDGALPADASENEEVIVGDSTVDSGSESDGSGQGTADREGSATDESPESSSASTGDSTEHGDDSTGETTDTAETAATHGEADKARQVVEWDANEPLDKRTLQRVLNRGHRIPDRDLVDELDYGEENAIEIADLLIDLGSELDVSAAVCYRAGELYADAMEHDIVRGKAKAVTAAAAFRVGTLLEEEHRPLAAIEDALAGAVESSEIADRERRLISELDIEPTIMLIQPQKYLLYLIYELGIDEDAPIVSDARSAAVSASAQGSGASPWSIIAAAVYYAGRLDGNQKLRQREIASAANLSEVTVRNQYHRLFDD